MAIAIHFSDHFNVSPRTIDRYGAFNVSLISDLPLFIDPFLLFNSRKRTYRHLHDEMIGYLAFLRDKSVGTDIDKGLLDAWYRFPEVKQTWLGFSREGNSGHGLGRDFAVALNDSLQAIFTNFGKEKITRGSHLEKLCLIKPGVGRDNISDFTTNLILEFLLQYTQSFALKFIDPALRRQVAVRRVHFNYKTETWEPRTFDLPWMCEDYVLLTPKDILTKDDTWINKSDLISDFERLPDAIPNTELRAQINNYFRQILPRRPRQKDRAAAASRTILQFPVLIDAYIRSKEDRGESAASISSEKVRNSHVLYVQQVKAFSEFLALNTAFYQLAGDTYQEAHARVAFLKDVIENKGGHKLFSVHGQIIERESDLHILYRLTWFATPSDITREANDGRGPVDFKISRGARDKTLVEFKLARNPQLRRNIERQVEVYKKASDAERSIKVILYFTKEELTRVTKILKALKLTGHQDIVLIDARSDNKPSGSRA